MKRKDKETLRLLDKEELIKRLYDLKKTLFTASLEKFTKTVKNTRENKLLKQKVAVIKTILQEKELIHE